MLTEEDKVRYKDDGESKEMPADSAKKLPDDHPAKKAWLAKQGGDSDDSGEKVKGADLFKSKEGEPKPKSDEPKSYIKYDDREDAYDAADEAVSDIIGDLGGETSVTDLVNQHADALKAYLNSEDPQAKTFIEDMIVDTQASISREQADELNKALSDNGIDHKVEYENIEREQDHDTRPKSPLYKDDEDDSGSGEKSDIKLSSPVKLNDRDDVEFKVAPGQDEASVIDAIKKETGFDDEEVFDDLTYNYDPKTGTVTIHSEEMDWDPDDIEDRLTPQPEVDIELKGRSKINDKGSLEVKVAPGQRATAVIDAVKKEVGLDDEEIFDDMDYSYDPKTGTVTIHSEEMDWDPQDFDDRMNWVDPKEESVNESFLSETAQRILSRRLR
jgi:hypothetical protein